MNLRDVSTLLRRARAAALLATLAVVVVGCKGHQIRGKVIEGPLSAAIYVDKDDPRLDGPGLPDAIVDLTLDPNAMDPKPLGATVSDGAGGFTVPVSAFGAGFLEYELGVLARRQGHQHVQEYVPMAGGSQRLLIMMPRGRDTYTADPDIVQETLDLGEKLQR